MPNLFQNNGVEIDLKEPENFLKIKETLTRMGVAVEDTLYQSCHILHKKGRYAILHFKELFILDGKVAETNIETSDYERRNTIVKLLEDWGLLTIQERDKVVDIVPTSEIKVIPYREKTNWTLVAKYNIGGNKFQKR